MNIERNNKVVFLFKHKQKPACFFKAGDKGNRGNQQTSLSVIDLINSLSTNNVLCQGPSDYLIITHI